MVNVLKFYTPKFLTYMYANSADPDQIVPEAAVPESTLFAIPLSILGNNCIKKANI